MSRYNALAPYCTYMSFMLPLAFLNAYLPTEVAVGSSSAQPYEKLPLHDIEETGHEEACPAHPDEVQTVQLGGVPASLLATKHAKPTAQMNIGATCGAAAHLPQPKQPHAIIPLCYLFRTLALGSSYRRHALAVSKG